MRSKNRSPSLSPHRRRLPTSRGSCPSPARPAGPSAGRRGWAGAPARRARRKRPGRRSTARRRGLMMAGSSPWPAACPFVRTATGGRPLEATVQLRCKGPRQSLTLMQRGEESRERKRGRKQRGKEKKDGSDVREKSSTLLDLDRGDRDRDDLDLVPPPPLLAPPPPPPPPSPLPPPPRLQKQKKISHTLWGSNPRPLGCNRGRQMSRGSKPSALIHCAKGALFSSRSFLGAAKTVWHF